MNKYIVVLIADSHLRIKGLDGRMDLEFNLKNEITKFKFIDICKEESGVNVHKHLQIEVEIYSNNIDTACKDATIRTDALLSSATFLNSVKIEVPKAQLAYDISPNKKIIEFTQFFYHLGIPTKAKRDIDLDNFQKFINALLKYKRSDRVGRALRWYRASLMQSDLTTKFSMLWFAFESLNPLLKQKLKLENPTRKCPKCGWEEEVPSPNGLHEFVKLFIKNGEVIYSKLNKIRIAIVHSTKNLSDISNDIIKYLPDLENITKRSIIFLLGLDINDDKYYLKPITNIPTTYLQIYCDLNEEDITKILKDGEHPHFKDEYVILDEYTNKQGKKSYKTNFNLKPFFNCDYTPKEYKIFGEGEGLKFE